MLSMAPGESGHFPLASISMTTVRKGVISEQVVSRWVTMETRGERGCGHVTGWMKTLVLHER